MYVDSQDTAIKNLEQAATETLESTASGLSNLLKMQQEAANASRRRKNLLVTFSTFVLLVTFMFWLKFDENSIDSPGGPSED